MRFGCLGVDLLQETLKKSLFATAAPRVAFVLLAITGCGGASSKPPPAAPTKPASTEGAQAGTPSDLSPNVGHDRRNDAGVRAPAKPLVLGKEKSAKCGKITGPFDTGAELLAGRLKLNGPAGAKVIPPPSPDSPVNEEESRVVVDHGKEGLAIFAKETFQLDPDRYEPDADAPNKPGTLDVEAAKFLKATYKDEEGLEIVPVEIGTGENKLRAYAARPKAPNAPPGKDVALALGLLVAHPDGTLQNVAFYVRGEHVRNATGTALVGCTRVAERIAATLAPGPRALERTAGKRHVADVSTDEELTLMVPADYVVVPVGAGAHIYKLKLLSLYAGNISIAIGSEPEKHAPRDADATVDGKLLGRGTTWRGKKTEKGGFFFAAEPLDAKDKGKTDARSAEVLVKAKQGKVLDEFRGVAETLSVAKRTK
jgi:hypothetical protein